MPDRARKRPNNANALARWDNEGGAAKGAPQKARDDMTSLAKEEEHMLRCLGAAVIMQWDDLPTAIQRELFEHAISMGKLDTLDRSPRRIQCPVHETHPARNP
jgi:hypothetical protein